MPIKNKEVMNMKFNLNIVQNKKIFFIITAVILVIGLASMIFRGFYWDIDFAGGTEITYHIDGMKAADETAKFEEIARSVLGDKINVAQQAGESEIIVKSLELDEKERDSLRGALEAHYSTVYAKETAEGEEASPVVSVVGFDSVSGSVSADLRDSAIISVTIAVILMLVYITVRFQFSSALAAVICLCHDVFIVLSAYSILQIPMSSSVIAVVLTILGYSINATIIIFDRVRENVKIVKNATFAEKVNISVNQSLMRSINTTITTLLTIGLIYILGVQTIKEFSLPLIVGILAGLYSSVFLAGSLWSIFKGKNTKIK